MVEDLRNDREAPLIVIRHIYIPGKLNKKCITFSKSNISFKRMFTLM